MTLVNLNRIWINARNRGQINMNTDHKQDDKIVCLDSWKKSKALSLQESQLSETLKNLSFGDLIKESNAIIAELNDEKLSCEAASKSKLILKEFRRRLEGQSVNFSSSLKDMVKNLEKKFFDLNRLI